MEKECFKCGVKKDISEFYKHPEMKDGYLNKCKECTKIDQITNYRENPEQHHTYDKQRQQDPERRNEFSLITFGVTWNRLARAL
jgi:hypothetical protein